MNIKTRRVNYFKITSFKNCDSVTILESFITRELFWEGEGRGKEENGEERAKALSFCHARDFLLDIVEAGWPRGKDAWYVVWWSREEAHPR